MRLVKVWILVCSVFIVVMAANAIRFRYGPNDAFWRTLMSPFEGTVWSAQFSESGFGKVELGMDGSEVTKLVGQPLRKDCDAQECFWVYTWHDSGTADFDQRWVVFNRSDEVTEIRKSFFID